VEKSVAEADSLNKRFLAFSALHKSPTTKQLIHAKHSRELTGSNLSEHLRISLVSTQSRPHKSHFAKAT